ncbi:MAG: hypothetical protein M3Q89_12735, partial [Verrucomicrobiota bacterium]|nr:hypothetical protein [Verrucomicrobiota bacterium]
PDPRYAEVLVRHGPLLEVESAAFFDPLAAHVASNCAWKPDVALSIDDLNIGFHFLVANRDLSLLRRHRARLLNLTA